MPKTLDYHSAETPARRSVMYLVYCMFGWLCGAAGFTVFSPRHLSRISMWLFWGGVSITGCIISLLVALGIATLFRRNRRGQRGTAIFSFAIGLLICLLTPAVVALMMFVTIVLFGNPAAFP